MSNELFAGTAAECCLPTPRSLIACLLCAFVLTACSDDGSTVLVESADPDVVVQMPSADAPPEAPDTPIDTPTQIPSGQPSVIVGDSSGGSLPVGTRAQAYTGTFDSGNGVFILDEGNRLLGLVVDNDGTVRSVRTDLSEAAQSTGLVRQFTYGAAGSNTGTRLLPFALTDEGAVEAVLEIVDGQRIASLSSELPLSLSAATVNDLLPISHDSLQGSWSGAYSLCDALGQNCAQFLLSLDVNGVDITGSSSMVASDGTNLLPSTVTGTLSKRGSVVDVSIRWNTYRYEGFAYVDADNIQQLMLVVTTNSEIADERILASALVRLL